jgi:hypothetical protein
MTKTAAHTITRTSVIINRARYASVVCSCGEFQTTGPDQAEMDRLGAEHVECATNPRAW